MEQESFLSYWQEEPRPKFESLTGDENAEAVIVGGGLCGLLCAYALLERGVNSIIVLEAREICGGTTAHTTAKITAQHGLIYRRLIDGAGEEFAKGYYEASRQAMDRFREIVQKEKIDCNLTDCDAYCYATEEQDVDAVEAEAAAAQKLSIDAECVKECGELPFAVRAAVRFGGQARFHPLKFAYAVARILQERGVRIYENTPAFALEDNVLLTGKGQVYGKNVLMCTHYPFENIRGFYFAKIVQNRSYLLALKGASRIKDMYLGAGKDSLTLRYQEAGEEGYLLLGGASHKTGHEAGQPHYAFLEQEAARLYPGCEVKYRWSAQDCMTNDGVPYVGDYRQFGKHVYLATGFNKWGMTGSMAASRVISDLIVDGKSEIGSVFSPERGTWGLQSKKFFQEFGDTVSNFAKGYTEIPKISLPDLKNETGGIVDYEGKKIGAYRNEEGSLRCVQPVCKHMNCPLVWNPEESTWDCPCHGSRYHADGSVFENPALQNLEKRGPN